MRLLVLQGSLRQNSLTSRLAQLAVADLDPDVEVVVSDLPGRLPAYDSDDDTPETVASEVTAFREQVAGADALLVVTPEYNGSTPGFLKNAIDWASRPRGSAPLQDKHVAVLSVSPSSRGAQWAREDTEKVLGVAGALVEGRTAGLGSAFEVFPEGGDTVTDHASVGDIRCVATDLVKAAQA